MPNGSLVTPDHTVALAAIGCVEALDFRRSAAGKVRACGTLKIARLMREAGHGPPTASLRDGAVVVTSWLPVESTGKPIGKTPVKRTEKRQTPQKTPQKTLQKAPEKVREKTTKKMTEKTDAGLIRILQKQPGLTTAELGRRLRKSRSTIERAVRRLRESGRLERIGPDKGGRWKVSE